MEKEKYYIVKEQALPEVLRGVVEAKRLLSADQELTIQEAVERVGISRSSFYKYQDDVLPFHENTRGKTINLMLQADDKPGLLSVVLARVADCHANILTIHQSIPIGGIASITLGLEILPQTDELDVLFEGIRGIAGVHTLKLLGRESS